MLGVNIKVLPYSQVNYGLPGTHDWKNIRSHYSQVPAKYELQWTRGNVPADTGQLLNIKD